MICLLLVGFFLRFGNCEYLYGFGHGGQGPKAVEQIIKIDVATANFTTIGDTHDGDIMDGLIDFDSKNGILYSMTSFQGSENNNVMYLDAIKIEDGSLLCHILLKPLHSVEVPGCGITLSYNSKTDTVYVAGKHKDDPDTHHVIEVNPRTQEMKDIGTFTGKDSYANAHTFDTENQLLYVIFGDIEVFDIAAGKVTKTISNDDHLISLINDPEGNQVLSWGLTEDPHVRTLYSIKDFSVQKLHEFPDFANKFADIDAIDSKNRMLYTLLQDKGADPYDPFHLLKIDLSSYDVQSKPLCDVFKVTPFLMKCPWSMIYTD